MGRKRVHTFTRFDLERRPQAAHKFFFAGHSKCEIRNAE